MSLLAAGLPNIQGDYWNQSVRGGSYSGAFITGKIKGTAYNGDQHEGWYAGLSIDASAYNFLYGNSTTVQPPAIQLIYQIKF